MRTALVIAQAAYTRTRRVSVEGVASSALQGLNYLVFSSKFSNILILSSVRSLNQSPSENVAMLKGVAALTFSMA